VSHIIPSSSDDVIDSREVIARIAELEAIRDGLESDRADAESDPEIGGVDPRDFQMDEMDADELKALLALRDEAAGYSPDWKYGATLIRDSYFEDYARELAEDTGAINRNADWPLSYIDWPAAADALKQDYTSVEFDGVTYWVR